MAVGRRADRRNEWWIDFRYRRRRIRKRSPIQTKRGAEQFERQLRQDVVHDETHGRDPFAQIPTFGEFVGRWLENYVEAQNRPSTIYSKTTAIRRHLLPAFGDTKLNEISTERIDALAACMRRAGTAPKTVNNVLSMLRCALSCAHSWRLLAHIPEIHWQKVPSQGYRYLEPDEADRLLAAATRKTRKAQFWYTLILFFLRTGGRFSEVAVLKWTDLSLDSARPFVRFWRGRSGSVEGPTKTNRCRDVPLASDLVHVLRQMPRVDDRVFGAGNSKLIKADYLLWSLRRLCAQAQSPGISWKDLRHTFATDLTRHGVPLNTVSRLLGHTTIQMTMRYAHSPEASMYQAVELLVRPPVTNDNASLESRSGHQVDTRAIAAISPPVLP